MQKGKACTRQKKNKKMTLTDNVSCFQNDHFYAACDDHTIRACKFPDGQADGILTRFTAPVTTMCCSKDGKTIIAGAW